MKDSLLLSRRSRLEVCLMVFALIACAVALWWVLGREGFGESAEGGLSDGSLKPREVDTYWVYDVQDILEDGSVVVEEQRSERILEHRTLDGKTLQLIQFETGSAGAFHTEYLWEFEDATGIYYWLDPSDSPELPADLSEFELYFPLNAAIGTKVETPRGYTELLATGTQITVPAGRFFVNVAQVTYYEEDLPSFRERYSIAPGIGLVQFEYDEWVDDEWLLVSREVLRSFEE